MRSARLREYIVSERFIHDNLVSVVDQIADRLRRSAQKGEPLRPMIVFWPEKAVQADNDALVTHTVLMLLQDGEEEEAHKHILAGAKRTNAYAVMLFTPSTEGLKLVLESKHGTASWFMRRQKRGDIYFVKAPVKSVDVDSLDVLWNKKQG